MARYRTIIIFLLGLAVMPIASALSLQGVTEFASRVELNAATSGIIKSIDVRPGQRVAKGDVLLRIDDIPQQAKLKKAQAMARALQPEVAIAQLELERAEELYAIDSLSQVDLQNAENKLARAEGNFQAAEAEAELAAYQLQQTTLVAPFDGRVLSLPVKVAQYVDPTVAHYHLATLADTRHMIAVAQLGAAQWKASLRGKSASIKLGNKTFKGKVSFVGYDRGRDSTEAVYTLHVGFQTRQTIPAGLPVSIEIKE